MARAEYREALRQLERSEPPMAARALTWAMVLEALGDHDHAAPYALRAVEVEPSETAASLAVKVLAKAGKVADALAVAQRFEWSRPAQKEGALAEVAFAQGAFADAAVHYGAAFELSGVAADAYNAACSLARAGARAEALGFIARALKAGLDDPEQIRSDPDFASLKGEPELERLLASVPRA
jgi:tetratricopeptide (TPR) repeat protein